MWLVCFPWRHPHRHICAFVRARLSAWQALLPPFCTLNLPSLAHLPVREQLSALRQPLGATSEQTKQRLFSRTSPWEPSLIRPPRTDHSPGHGADHSVVTLHWLSTENRILPETLSTGCVTGIKNVMAVDATKHLPMYGAAPQQRITWPQHQ